jgi:hypothetical protein
VDLRIALIQIDTSLCLPQRFDPTVSCGRHGLRHFDSTHLASYFIKTLLQGNARTDLAPLPLLANKISRPATLHHHIQILEHIDPIIVLSTQHIAKSIKRLAGIPRLSSVTSSMTEEVIRENPSR